MSGNSFRPQISPRRRAFARLLGDIQQELARVMADTPRVSKAEIARRLGINRSLVTRRLNGTSNMTLESLSDLAWALDQRVIVRLEDRTPATVWSNAVGPGALQATHGHVLTQSDAAAHETRTTARITTVAQVSGVS